MEKFLEELDAGRLACARGRPQEFAAEVEAGRCAADRVRERLKEEFEAGRRAAAR